MEFKFAIGDYLTPKAHADLYPLENVQVLVVSERFSQQCEGGVQLHYDCRAIVPPSYRSSASFSEKYFRLKESEVVALDIEAYREAIRGAHASSSTWTDMLKNSKAHQ